MKDYNRIKHMRNLNDSLIWERMKRCYDFGYEDGKADTPFTDTEEAEKKAYNRGLADSWNVIKKITRDDSVGGYSIEMMQELFGHTCVYDITHNYTAEEAIAKIKEYEDKQKQDAEIKVGYEVYNIDRENKRIVTAIDGNKAIQLCSNGKYTVDNIDTLRWTGREDLRIKKVLEKITKPGAY